jgi:hypothetical protein
LGARLFAAAESASISIPTERTRDLASYLYERRWSRIIPSADQGIANASFTLAMKFAGKWVWENTWLVFTIFSL